ncbi:MAG: hypothetical protein CME10_14865 [Gemmatimonadetes bacterium]|nr:hypothetical protein [Gemmatimonadota bacterium]|tara:strand:- start:218 stop:466 length:249 start_codon:yes stop_codon:yes gene_type:complete
MISYNEKENRYSIEVSKVLPRDFIPLVQDIVKLWTIILLYNFMMFSADRKSTNMATTAIQLLYVTIGIVVYWVIFDKMFILK